MGYHNINKFKKDAKSDDAPRVEIYMMNKIWQKKQMINRTLKATDKCNYTKK